MTEDKQVAVGSSGEVVLGTPLGRRDTTYRVKTRLRAGPNPTPRRYSRSGRNGDEAEIELYS